MGVNFSFEDLIRGAKLKAVFERIDAVLTGFTAGVAPDGSITNVKVAAGIDAVKLADGTVSNTEFQYLNGVTGPIQTQLNNITANITEGTPVNAVAASKALTIDGVVTDGETVTLGNAVYEFCADAAQTLTAPTNKPVDITAHCTASSGTLTLAAQPTIGDTMTIGTKLYTFCAAAAVNGDGDISIGTNLATAKTAIVNAVNGNDSVNDPHPLVTMAAFDGNDSVITAIVGGVAGDLIATTETFTAEPNIFASTTLGSGADCTKANAKTALLAAVTANATKNVSTADGTGDIVTCTAVTKGIAGNSIAIAETMAHGAFAGAATALSGGVDGTVAADKTMYADDNYIYRCTATNTISDANWKRTALSSY